MKKIIQLLFILTTLFLLTSCSKSKDGIHPVSIGNLAFQYDSGVWTYHKSSDEKAPLEFKDKSGNTLSVYVSQESTYQHPMEMITFLESMMTDYDQFELFLSPTKIDVNGTTWYEYGYSYQEGDTKHKVYQRFYGKYYNAASITFRATEKTYEKGYAEALKLMSEIITTDIKNDENEAKAREFLVGEWDLIDRGYLVIMEDSTYEWYKDSSKDKNNMHYGTYGCDVENINLELKEGDGIYLVLFPESLIINGVAEENTNYKNDYLISFQKNEAGGYPMVHMASYSLATMIKQ